MSMLSKIFKWLSLIFLFLFIVFTLLFFRRDLSTQTLEKKYFTAYSHYEKITISTLQDTEESITIHYQDLGNTIDPVIVLLHGAFSSSHTFLEWASQLVDANYRVILIDLPYHGLSGGFSDHTTSLRRSSEVVKSLLNSLEIDSFYIGGNSMGGGVSWYLAGSYHLHAFDIKGLILIDAVFPSDATHMAQRFSNITKVPGLTWYISHLTPRFIIKNLLLGVYGQSADLTDEVIDRYYDLLRHSGHRRAILINEREDISLDEQLMLLDHIRDTGLPVLVLWGAEDTWVPVSVSLLFKEKLMLEDSQIIIFEALGHVPMEEQPVRTLIPVLAFINQ